MNRSIINFFELIILIIMLPFFFKSNGTNEIARDPLKERVATTIVASSWMSKQIHEDLKPFISGFSPKNIDEELKKIKQRGPFARFAIENNCVIIKDRYLTHVNQNLRLERFLNNLNFLHETVGLPLNLDFVVALDDFFKPTISSKIPLFCYSKNLITDKDIVLVPQFERTPQCIGTVREVEASGLLYPWSKKIKKALWRGRQTNDQMRKKLVEISLNNPELIDARLVKSVSTENGLLYGTSLRIGEHIKYSYILAVDGVTWPSSMLWQLFSNSLTLKQNSQWVEWFYAAVKPYEHYVPVKADYSDLLSMIEWCKSNESQVATIIDNANGFARENLTTVDQYFYLYLVLWEYSKLLKNN